MRTILRISDAAAIALHAADLMAKGTDTPLSVAGISKKLGVSHNHLSKIMQRLTKAGFVSPLRGPKGGFILSGSGLNATLKDILESVEGPLIFSDCLMENKVCGRRNCLLSGILSETNRQFERALSKKVSAFAKSR